MIIIKLLVWNEGQGQMFWLNYVKCVINDHS
jgi:hypothetical protein